MKKTRIFLNHLKIFCVLFAVIGLQSGVRAVTRESIRCRCDTKECRLHSTTTCSTKGSCYVQEPQPSLLKDRTRGCIAGEASQSLLCTSHSLPSFLKESKRWPRLVCCSSDLCNAPGLLDKVYNGTQSVNHLSGSPGPTFNGTSSLMNTPGLSNGTPDDAFSEKQTAGSLSQNEAFSEPKGPFPKDAPRRCESGPVACTDQRALTRRSDGGDGYGTEPLLADMSDNTSPANGQKQAAQEDGASLLHTVLMVLTVLCTVMLCTIVLLVYASARYPLLPSKYCNDTGLQYVMV